MKKKLNKIYTYLLATAFLLGVKDGNLALWVDEDPSPYRIFSARADSFPPKDQILLKRGIHAGSVTELLKLLNDYF